MKNALLYATSIALALSLFSARARAQLSPNDAAAVLALYNEGKDLMERGRYPEAIAKFEQARFIDATAVNNRLDLAACYEKVGKVASAFNEYNVVAGITKALHDPRAKVAALKAEALAPRVPRLSFDVDSEAAKLAGFEVRVNGVPLSPKLWSLDTPIDPGVVKVEAVAAGRKKWARDIEMNERGRRVVLVPMLEREDGATPERAPAVTGRSRGPLGPRRDAAIALAGGGLVALGVAGGFATSAIHFHSASDDGHCTAKDECDEEGLVLRKTAEQRGDVATALSVVSALAFAGATVLWLSAPPRGSRPAVGVALAPRAFSLRGSF